MRPRNRLIQTFGLTNDNSAAYKSYPSANDSRPVSGIQLHGHPETDLFKVARGGPVRYPYVVGTQVRQMISHDPGRDTGTIG